jgi:hypothetical protein
MAVPSVFALALALIVTALQRATQTALAPGGKPVAPTAEMMLAIMSMFVGMTLIMLVYFVVYMVALGATSLAVSELYLGRTAAIGDVYGRMRGRVGRLVLLMLIAMLRVGAVAFVGVMLMGMSAFVLAAMGGGRAGVVGPLLTLGMVLAGWFVVAVVCVYMMLRYGVAVPALVLENLTARNAIRRSIELTRGGLMRVFLLVVLATLVSYAGLALFQGPFAFASFMAGPETVRGFWLNLAGVVFGTIGATFTAPIMIVGLALLYYDMRIRHEGFDLDVMIDALDKKGPPPEPARA